MTLICKSCETPIERKHKTGRPPQYCKTCAEARIKASNIRTCKAWYAKKSQDEAWRAAKKAQARAWREARKQQDVAA